MQILSSLYDAHLFEWSVANDGSYPIPEFVVQILWFGPNDMVELPRVEMHMFN